MKKVCNGYVIENPFEPKSLSDGYVIGMPLLYKLTLIINNLMRDGFVLELPLKLKKVCNGYVIKPVLGD